MIKKMSGKEKQDRNRPVIIIKKTHYWLVKNTNERIKKGRLTNQKGNNLQDMIYLHLKYHFQQKLNFKKKEKFLSFEIV